MRWYVKTALEGLRIGVCLFLKLITLVVWMSSVIGMFGLFVLLLMKLMGYDGLVPWFLIISPIVFFGIGGMVEAFEINLF